MLYLKGFDPLNPQALLDLLLRLFESVSRAETLASSVSTEEEHSKQVSRLASEYTQLVYLANKASSEGCKIVATLSDRILKVRQRLSQDLSELLVQSFGDVKAVRGLLRTYEVIEGWRDAEEVVRREVKAICDEVRLQRGRVGWCR